VKAVKTALTRADGSVRYLVEGLENADLDVGAIRQGTFAFSPHIRSLTVSDWKAREEVHHCSQGNTQ
jgi:hypothetical protein